MDAPKLRDLAPDRMWGFSARCHQRAKKRVITDDEGSGVGGRG